MGSPQEKAFFLGRQLGYQRIRLTKDPKELKDISGFWYSFEQTDEYANDILPKLREMAGCEDPFNMGTFTQCTIYQEQIFDEILSQYMIGHDEAIREKLDQLEM